MGFVRSFLLLVVVLAVLVPARVEAQRQRRPPSHPHADTDTQEADSESDEARARRHFETGASLYVEGNYEGALAAFDESYRIRQIPVVLFNLAQTYRRLYRYEEAIEAYRRYLRTAENLPTADATAVRATITELSRALAPVTITTDVPNAEVRVDDRIVGTTPLDGPLALAAGTRHVEASLDGHVTVREDVTVVGGEALTVRLRLPPADTAGTLRVRANVDGSAVRIDGVAVGIAPVERRLGSGGHQVEVAADGFEPYRNEIVLAPRQERDLFVELGQERALFERWWFWAAAGGAVVVIAAIVIAALATGGQADPIPGTLGTVTALVGP